MCKVNCDDIKKLISKIDELGDYIIGLSKERRALQSQVSSLDAKMNSFKGSIKELEEVIDSYDDGEPKQVKDKGIEEAEERKRKREERRAKDRKANRGQGK